MLVDKRGRAGKLNLSPKQGLLPVIEAVINSVHAINDAKESNGRIDLHIERDTSQGVLVSEGDEIQLLPIKNFVIKDNGVGFSDVNFDSFNRSDSTYKLERGGKGVGRFLWLNAFERVEVQSVFEREGRKYRRDFVFSFDDEPSENANESEVGNDTPKETIIKLLGFREKFSENTVRQADTIAKHIVDHCLMFFIRGNMPNLFVIDEAPYKSMNANLLYKESLKSKKDDSFNIGDYLFDLVHVMFEATSSIHHKVSYFGNDRVVEEKTLKPTDINGLSGKLDIEDGDASVVYVACVSGQYLDSHIADDRTSFSFPKEDELELGVSFDKIQDFVLSSSKEFLNPYTKPILDDNRNRIIQTIHEEMPKYRILANHYSERFDDIPSNLSRDKLDLALYQLDKEVGWELRQKAEEIISSNDVESFSNPSFFEEFSEYGKAKLAEYIAHRHSILRLLQTSLAQREDGKYAPEKAIHNLIFPMGSTSDDIGFEDHNLWIIDERLAYHYYLASDKKINKLEPINSSSVVEPDLVVFNHPFAIVNEGDPPYQSIVIFEFKRPMRNNYKDGRLEDYGDNPIDQVNRYVMDILKGTTDSKGRPLKAQAGTPFYGRTIGG